MTDLTLTMEVTSDSRRESIEDLPKSVIKQEDGSFIMYNGASPAKTINADPLKVEEESKFDDLNQILNMDESLADENTPVNNLVVKIKQEELDLGSEDSPDEFIVEREPESEFGGHPCPSCSKAFRQLGFLHRHLKTMHNIEAPSRDGKITKKGPVSTTKSVRKAKKRKPKSPKKSALKPTTHKPLKKKIKTEVTESDIEMDETEKELTCDLCGHKCKDSAQLERHKRSHSSEKPYSCNRCSYSSKQKSSLDEHKKIHGIQDFACSKCGLSFDSERRLKRHSLIHKKSFKATTCDICNFSAADRIELRKHKTEQHSKENTLTCEVCGYQTTRPSSFRAHKLTHERHLSFSCGVCKYTCLTLTVMKKHVYTHIDEKPFKCHMCDKSFKIMDALKRHVQVVHFRADEPTDLANWSNSDHE